MNTPIMSFENVKCGYPGKTVLNGCSFDIKGGEFVSLAGPNGAGKTTLVRAIYRIVPLMEGDIKYAGMPICRLTPKMFAVKAAALAQPESELCHEMTVSQYVTLGRVPHMDAYQFSLRKADENAVREAMSMTGVTGFGDRLIKELSSGERQRVFLAKALAQEPEFLVLDEPTAHLDMGRSWEIFSMIKKLSKEKNITVLSIMHDLNLASAYSDRILILDGGRIAYNGAPLDVIKPDTVRKVYSVPHDVRIDTSSGYPQILY